MKYESVIVDQVSNTYLGGRAIDLSAEDYHQSYCEARFKTDDLERQVKYVWIILESYNLGLTLEKRTKIIIRTLRQSETEKVMFIGRCNRLTTWKDK